MREQIQTETSGCSNNLQLYTYNTSNINITCKSKYIRSNFKLIDMKLKTDEILKRR